MTTKHSNLGPSSAERWFNCPGSVGLSATLPPDRGSVYAAEGTLAHTLADELVTGKVDHLTLMGRLGQSVNVEGYNIEITEDMVDAAIEYVDIIAADTKALMLDARPAAIVGRSEVRVAATSIDPSLYGTSDYILYRKGHKLIVYDFKYGKGVAVEAEDNKQMLIYAIAAMDTIICQAFDNLELVIIQPRAPHVEGSVRRWAVSSSDLEAFRKDLKAAVKAAQGDTPKIEAGSWCRFCPAKAVCPTMFGAVQKSAAADFAVAPRGLPAVETLPIEKLAKALEWEDVIVSWYEAIKNRVRETLEAGGEVPGYKLVDGRSNRRWVSESAVIAHYEGVLGEDQLFEKKLLSPAKLEKIVGKGKLAPGLTESPPGKKAIARDNDPRPVARSSAAEDFAPTKGMKNGKASVADLEAELLGSASTSAPPTAWPQDER